MTRVRTPGPEGRLELYLVGMPDTGLIYTALLDESALIAACPILSPAPHLLAELVSSHSQVQVHKEDGQTVNIEFILRCGSSPLKLLVKLQRAMDEKTLAIALKRKNLAADLDRATAMNAALQKELDVEEAKRKEARRYEGSYDEFR